MKNETERVRRLVLAGSVIAVVAILVALAGTWLLYQRTTTLLTDNLRQRLLTISITQASNISADDLDVLRTREDTARPEWAKVVTALHGAKYSNNDVVFMYLFRKTATDPTQMEFIADADSLHPDANTDDILVNNVDVNRDGILEPDGPDKLQWPGQPYPEAVDIPETFEAYNGPLTAADLYTDAYGTVLTGYAPIKNASGTVVAVLATDIKADDFFTITRQTLAPFLVFISFLVLVISLLTIILISTWRKRAQELANLDSLKSQFLSIASHDLRSPITVIRNFASLALDGTYGTLPKAAEDGMRQVFERATHMASMVSTYLSVSRIEQGRMEYEFVDADITKIATETVNFLQQGAQEKGLTLSIEVAPGAESMRAKLDVPKMNEVLVNLIDNSIKYTPTGSIVVSVERVGRRARITLKDTGVGMTPKTIRGLFKLFSPGDGSKKINPSSTGIGMYVSKAHVEAHGGTLTGYSEGEGKGSQFVLDLPLLP
jgi:signal transduction histidine kinase